MHSFSSTRPSRALAAVVAVAALIGWTPAAHAGISFTTGQGHSGAQVVDPGAAHGESVVLDFNSTTTPAGITRIDGAAGTFGFNVGDTNGVAAEPSADSSQYFYVGTGGNETFLFGNAVSTASFYWGSVDDYNHLDVLGGSASDPVVLETISGWQAVGQSSDTSRHFGQSLRIFIADSTPGIVGLRFRSDGQSFEFDDVAVSGSSGGSAGQGTFAPVPETSVWALLILGFAGLGAALRRRRQAGVAFVA